VPSGPTQRQHAGQGQILEIYSIFKYFQKYMAAVCNGDQILFAKKRNLQTSLRNSGVM
jgi:hypothetical protein